MDADITTAANPIAEVVTELKNSVSSFIQSAKGSHPDLDQYLETLQAKLASEEHLLNFSQLVQQFEQKRSSLDLHESDIVAQEREELSRLISQSAKKTLSSFQLERLNNLLTETKQSDLPPALLLTKFAMLLDEMSDEIEVNRKQAKIVVDHNPVKLKQEGTTNSESEDLQTASKRLCREMAHISQLMSEAYPEDSSLLALKIEAETIQNKPKQFFKALDLLQTTNRHVSQMIQRERYHTQEVLQHINARFSGVIASTLEIDAHFSEGNDQALSLHQTVKTRLTRLKSKAEKSGSVEDMQKLLDEGISSVARTLDGFAKKQQRLVRKSKDAVQNLTRDVTQANNQLKIMQRKLDAAEENILIDELSQTGNRRGYLNHMEKAYKLWRTGKQSLSLVVMDIDRFKMINDKYGHSVGDQIIRKVGSILNEALRTSDYVARYGGEEFVIVCNGANGKQAARLADKLRLKLAKRNFRLREKEEVIQVTASFGVADFNDDRYKITEVFDAADHALYSAKKGGRNRVMLMDGAALVSLR